MSFDNRIVGRPFVDEAQEGELALGHGHYLQYFSWSPDRSIPENARRYAGIDDIEKAGVTVRHKDQDGKVCKSAIHFDTDAVAKIFPNAEHRWNVVAWEPLTLSPSLLCMACKDHGFIRDGVWVPA